VKDKEIEREKGVFCCFDTVAGLARAGEGGRGPGGGAGWWKREEVEEEKRLKWAKKKSRFCFHFFSSSFSRRTIDR
jgi:hypothetical protein